ncbi:MAG: hypothetical protein NC123_20160, partial [Butyrivibrio sp.]|nr:hypothetical protein [Butyrivibrio sp.]
MERKVDIGFRSFSDCLFFDCNLLSEMLQYLYQDAWLSNGDDGSESNAKILKESIEQMEKHLE